MSKIIDSLDVPGPLRLASPSDGSWFDGSEGQRLKTILSGDQLSITEVHTPRGHVTVPHVHQATEVVVHRPRSCAAQLTLTGDDLGYVAWLSPVTCSRYLQAFRMCLRRRAPLSGCGDAEQSAFG
jgi:hypothetical protein